MPTRHSHVSDGPAPSALVGPPGSALRSTGLEVVGDAPWGTHFCAFYETPEDLREILVPYFKAGLEGGEFCMWVTSPPLGVDAAWEALAQAVPDLESYRRRGRIEILPHTDWYLRGGTFDSQRVLDGWVAKLEEGVSRGCAGLRLTGNTFWLEKGDWTSFAEYEAAVDAVLGRYRMLALCTYASDRCGVSEVADVIRNHQFALIKREGRWQQFESCDRRRMQDAIAVERERLAVTLHSIGDAVVGTDTEGRVTTMNLVAEELTGWTRAEASGQPVGDVFRIVREGTEEPANDPVRKVLAEGTAAVLANHTELVARDGRRLPIDDSAAPIRGPAGELLGAVLVFRDASATRRAEKEREATIAALRESEERYRLLFQNMLDGFAYCRMLYDARGLPDDFVYLDVNGAFEKLTGLRDVVGRRVTELIPGVKGSHPELFETYARVARTGRPERFEIDFRPLGKWFSISVYSPQPDHFVAVFDDVTARRSGEERIRRQNAVLAGIARIFRQALTCETEEDLGRACLSVVEEVTKSRFGFVGELNPRTNRLDDIAVSDPGWDVCRAGLPPRHGGRVPIGFEVRGIYGRVLRDGKGFFTNDPGSHPDRIGTPPGHPPLKAFLGVPLLHAGRTIGMVAVANRGGGYGDEDLECAEALAPAIVQALLRKRAEEEVRSANAQLTDAARRKDDFLSMLSHELRNPLAPIRNSIHVLEKADPAGEQARHAKEVIRRQSEHLARIVDDLLDVTRIARGKIEVKRAPLDLGTLVRRAGEDHTVLMRDRGLEFAVVLPREPLWTDGDATRLAQVVGNLLHNAAKFTAQGGRVELALEAARGGAEIHVRDTGVGMEPEFIERVFEPFVQAERTMARTDGGLGLGLALVKAVAELHGGSVRAASAGPGKGSEFVVRLPVVDAAAAALAPPPRIARAEASRRVLIIDDNRDAADSLAQIVEMFGHVAEIAYDGPSGVARAKENCPDVILCDIGLPGMNGYEVVQALRGDAALRAARMFAVSGHAQPEDRKKALEAGFDRHIAKPLDLDEIERILSGPPA
ncbi:MAG TPA: MEDS domain-containing protein [Anaeromyxobacter sp.]|nr:MEDS domain-containing protein [Anaeromyxobacter sp.]